MANDPEDLSGGLLYLPEFVDEDAEVVLLDTVDQQPWCTTLRRRVQQYGYRYDYKSRTTRSEMYLGPLPSWLEALAEILLGRNGIAAHVDCVPCFTDTIASLSLGSSCVMALSNDVVGKTIPLFIERRSLLVLTGESRFEWKHAIAARRSDHVNGRTTPRSRRVSLTFRKVI
jgi:alkylated DNA repair dioxygenase AlkB